MAETESEAVTASTTTSKKANFFDLRSTKLECAKLKKDKIASSEHPKVAEMVNTAISSINERGGSSAHAIKKYIDSHYKVDIDRLSLFINKYLKSSVASGTLVQTKGKGASGSFKMGSQTKQKSSNPKSAESKITNRVPSKKPSMLKTPKKDLTKKPKAKITKSSKKSKPPTTKVPKSKHIAGIMKIGRYNKAPSIMGKK